jgi:hypothetical protein
MEDDLNILENVRRPEYFSQMKDDINILANERRPQYFGKWRTTSIFWRMEDNLDIL